VPLTDWPRDRLGVVVHIEDEPPRVLREVLNAGLRPGTAFRLLDRNAAAVTYETAAGRYALAPVIAAYVHVQPLTALRKPHFACDLQGGAFEDRMRNRDPIRGWGARPAAPG
jgi:Fe2+ transport system protein FeoA